MKQCLVYAISPIQAVTSICAVRASHPDGEVEVTVLVHWPGVDDELLAQLTAIFRDMLRPFPFVKTILSFSQAQLNEILELGKRALVAGAIQRALARTSADEIYYSHDVTGELYQTLATAFPGARRICFGDAMGMVFERRVHLGYLGIKPPSRLLGAVQRMLGRSKRLLLDDFPPHEAALVLPVDQSGKFLERIPLTVCPRATVLEVVSACAESCQSLKQYQVELEAKYAGRRKYLLLTENTAEGGFMEFDREVEMYASVIEGACQKDGVVFLKSHPGESLPRNERIRERLGSRFEVVELDKRFRRHPIELWRDLVTSSTVICASTPVLSLKYLYDVDVIQPMDDAFIERWFPEWSWASYKNAISLYMDPLRALPQWNGKGVLWAPRA